MLDEIELLVRGGGPEVRAAVGDGLLVGSAFLVDHGDAALLTEGWIGDHHRVVGAGLVSEAVVGLDWRLPLVVVGADAMEKEVHGTEP